MGLRLDTHDKTFCSYYLCLITPSLSSNWVIVQSTAINDYSNKVIELKMWPYESYVIIVCPKKKPSWKNEVSIKKQYYIFFIQQQLIISYFNTKLVYLPPIVCSSLENTVIFFDGHEQSVDGNRQIFSLVATSSL